jgi:hypothetical protein
MKSIEILKEIRESREVEIQNLLKYNSNKETNDLIRLRKAILLLEFPFRTDEGVDLIESERKSISEVNVELFFQRISMKKENEKVTLNEVLKKWFSVCANKDQLYAKKSFALTLEKLALLPLKYLVSGEMVEAFIEDYKYHSVIKYIVAKILNQNYTDETKENYLSKLDEILFLITGEFKLGTRLRNQIKKKDFYLSNPKLLEKDVFRKRNMKGRISIENVCPYKLAQLYEYLENRFLRSHKTKDLLDLIELRCIFYVPLTVKELAQIKVGQINFEKKHIFYEEGCYFELPKTFIDLLASIKSPSDSLVEKNEQQLYKLTRKLSLECGLHHFITPSYIKEGLQAICFHFGFLPEKLARR